MDLRERLSSSSISAETLSALLERYAKVPPLIFFRSVERARSAGELFDILDTIPEYPIVWNELDRKWTCHGPSRRVFPATKSRLSGYQV